MPYNKNNQHQQTAKPSQSYWDIKDAKTQRSIMIGQCFNLVIEKQIDFNLDNPYIIEEIKNKTTKLYLILKELHEEL